MDVRSNWRVNNWKLERDPFPLNPRPFCYIMIYLCIIMIYLYHCLFWLWNKYLLYIYIVCLIQYIFIYKFRNNIVDHIWFCCCWSQTEIDQRGSILVDCKELLEDESVKTVLPTLKADIRDMPQRIINCLGVAFHQVNSTGSRFTKPFFNDKLQKISDKSVVNQSEARISVAYNKNSNLSLMTIFVKRPPGLFRWLFYKVTQTCGASTLYLQREGAVWNTIDFD